MNLELSMRKTRKWLAKGRYDGSLAVIYLPQLAKECDYHLMELKYAGNWPYQPPTKEDAWSIFYWVLNWTIVHELIHNLEIRHTKTWTSEDIP